MESPTFTVPSTDTYYDRFTGVGVRLTAGDVITQRRAWLLQMSGAVEPSTGLTIVRNWIPDGGISSAALIDTEGDADFENKFFYGVSGAETLTYVLAASNPGPAQNAVGIACPGSGPNEGVVFSDWIDAYGMTLPAGRYSLGFTITSSVTDADLAVVVALGEDWDTLYYGGQSKHTLVGASGRIVVHFGLPESARPVIQVSKLGTPASSTLYLSEVMLTDGDPILFAGGDSPGWSWVGTPHASASYGPQP